MKQAEEDPASSSFGFVSAKGTTGVDRDGRLPSPAD
jgi:hypothetical protein